MTSHITIGNYTFKTGQVAAIKVKESRKTIGNTALVKIPNYGKKMDILLKVGDAVKISFGYDEQNIEHFTGFVASISPKNPIEISCEDMTWNLKQEQVSKSWRTTDLHTVLRYLFSDIQIECLNIKMSPFRLDKVSKFEALNKIKKEFGLDVYFRDQKLYVGFAYNEKDLPFARYHFQKNALIGSLVYKTKEGVRLKVKAISIQSDNSRITVDLGDKDGEQRTLHYYNKTASEMKVLAEEHIKLMKYDGYQGKLRAKGVPFVTHSMIVELMDDFYPQRHGNYFVDEIVKTYDSNGINFDIELGKKAS